MKLHASLSSCFQPGTELRSVSLNFLPSLPTLLIWLALGQGEESCSPGSHSNMSCVCFLSLPELWARPVSSSATPPMPFLENTSPLCEYPEARGQGIVLGRGQAGY